MLTNYHACTYRDRLKCLQLSLDCISSLGAFADADGSRDQFNENDPFPSWDNGSACGGDEAGDYEGDHHSDIEDPGTLITQPRQVGFIEHTHLLLINSSRYYTH